MSGIIPADDIFARAGTNYSAATAYGGPGTVYLNDRSLPSNNGKLQITNWGGNETNIYQPYRISGQIDTPLHFHDTKAVIAEGAHLGALITGSSYASAYIAAEGNFTAANDELVVDGFTLELPQDYSFDSITVQNSGKITTPVASDVFTAGITLSATDFYVSSNSYIDVSGKGRRAESGAHWKSGGSYGGSGGIDPLSGTVAPLFGSFEAPADFGVGGQGVDESAEGSRGGGAIKLVASNKFEIYGDILANGNYLLDAGGGSGGSVWIEAAEIVGGSGTLIEASGGRGYRAGTGGGGRIALYYDAISGIVPRDDIFARAGTNYSAATAYGGPGTVYLNDRSLPSNNGKLQITNWGGNETNIYQPYRISGQIDTPLHFHDTKAVIAEGAHLGVLITGSSYNRVYITAEGGFTAANNELVVDGITLELSQDYSFDSITVQNSGKITTPVASDVFTAGITLNATDFYVGSNSYIDVSGKGSLPSSEVGYKSGGSYGGLGGVYSGEPTNAVFGSAIAPTDFGMGGRYQDDSQEGTRGGGAIKLVADRLEHHGFIYANGAGNYSYKGAGAGGSIWIEAGELISGTFGYIYADGGYGSYAGAGGGGRVAIYYESAEGLNTGRIHANAGGANITEASAEHGTVHIAEISAPPRVREVIPSGYHDVSISDAIVRFNIGIDQSTLDVSDFELLDGTGSPIEVLAVQSLDDIRFQVDFAEVLAEGTYTLNIGPDIFATNGLGMDQDQDGIELEPVDDKFSTQIIIDLTEPEALTLDQPSAPIVIASNSRWVTLSGNREDNTAILVNGSEIVPHGTGSWSGNYYLPEGESTISVVAQDQSGNQSAPVLLAYNIDSRAPSINGANPSGSQNVAPPFITLVVTEEGSGIDLDASALDVKRNGVSLAGSLALFEGQVQFTPDAPFLDGEYQIIARIADNLGNLSSQKTYNFVLDYTPPAPTVLGEYPSITTVNAQAFSGSKEAGSAVLVNGSLQVIESASTTWSTQVALVQGDNTIEFVVRDAAGNESTPTAATIRYDNNPPGQVGLSIDPNGRGTDLLLDWSSYDEFTNGNDIGEYRLYQGAAAFTDIAGKTPVATVAQGSKQFRVEGLPRATAAHFAVVAYDTQGLFNPAVTSVSAIPVDVQAPDDIANLVVEPGADSLSLRWNPSANSDGDLAGYKVAFVDDAEGRVDDIPLASLPDPAAIVQYAVTGLSPATAYPIRVYAYDASGNASSGVTDAGTTLLPNPATVTTEAKSSQVGITWSSVAPYNLLQNYAVYVEEATFSSVEGLQPKKVQSKGLASDSEHTWSLAGLKNGTTYYVAVTAINISGGSEPQVTPVAVTPVADTEGPVIESAEYQQTGQGGALFDLAGVAELSQDGRFQITASDDSDIARVEFFVDGNLLGTEYAASNGVFQRNLTLQSLSDGEHALTVKVFDVWENSTIGQYTFQVLLASPAAPQITAPLEGSISNQPLVLVQGDAELGTQVQLYRDGTAVGDLQLVNSYGKFQIEITLEEGSNGITAAAEYPNRSGGFGPQSTVRTLELNTSIPDAPANLTVIERELGQVSLSWDVVESSDADNTIAGYNVYRATSSFGSRQQAQQLNHQLLSEPKFSDLPAVDGHYFYAVTAVNEAATESALSSVVEAHADSEGPHVLNITYQSNGVVDAASGRHAPGSVEVEVQFDEPLRNQPYFAMVPEGGVPLTVELSKDYSDDTLYTGRFVIEPGMRSGTAYAVMSAHDDVGNRGTEIEQGGTLLIDAQGPEVIALTLNPGAPLQVDAQEGLLVEVVAKLDGEVKPGAQPTLIPQLDSIAITEYSSGISLTRDAQSIEGEPLWVGSFTLPTRAGQDAEGNPTVASLSFFYEAADDLDNLGSKVRVRNAFQVYQGDLPPLDIPQNLRAVAQPNAGVALTWDPVEDARYVLYRRAEGETEFTELQRLSETQADDQLPTDGQYQYAIASERRSNDQIAVSALSAPVAVSADSIAPAAPTGMALELNGAGIVATWIAPTQDAEGNTEEGVALTYNLYRLNLGEGENATAELLQNVTPLQTGIPEPIALDTNPSESQHAYAVVALDEAGNASAPSDTAYLNFGLLPVSDLSISVTADGHPQLQWQHSGAAIAGYRVYVAGEAGEGEDNLVEITNALIPHSSNPTTFVDDAFTAGTQGVTAERRYTVIAEDDQGATSIGHSLLLPALSVEVVEPEDGQSALARGVMNEVRFRVQNRGSGDATGIQLFATVNDNGSPREHRSASFSVAAGGIVEVPIVIGGYAKLDTLSELQLRLEQSPLPGETVFIHAQDQVLVGDAALRLSLESDTVYRGGLGKFRFILENTSAVETELLMARNNGKAASDEIRIRLEDSDGNLLTLQDVQQYTGDVITVASGDTVARLQPGERFTSEWVDVPVPAAAPDRITVALEVDHFRYHTGKATQVIIDGNGTRSQVSLQETAYYGALDTVTPAEIYTAEDTVTITGQALDRSSDTATGNVPLTLVMELRGFERQASVIADSDGHFSYTFDPQGQSGTWRVSVIHPDSLARPNQGEFRVLTSEVTPNQVKIRVPRNYNQVVPITVNAGYGSALSNVRLVPVAAPGEETLQVPAGIHLDLGAVIDLAAQAKGVINLTLSGDNLAPESGFLYFQARADVNGSEQVLDNIAVEYELSESRPVVSASPSFIDTGVVLGDSITEPFTLNNTGFDVLRNSSLALVDDEGNPAPNWLSLNGTTNLGDLGIGDSRDLSLQVAPDAGVTQGNYRFKLQVTGDGGHSFSVPIYVAVVTAEIGDVFFHVSDIYTATLGENNQLIPGLQGAKIELQNEQVLSETRTISSDANGEALLKDLPAGRYSYRVTAFDHESVSGRLWVKPGITVAEDVFLMNQIISVEWQVNEINLEDRYEIKLEATFETHVPVAVVMLDPLSITLPDMQKGDVFTGELSLTNYGLIRADNVNNNLPSGNDVVEFEFLAEVPATLEAGEVVYIPYRITALRDFNPNEEGDATGAGCGSYSYQYQVSYESRCANGQVVPGGTSTRWATASYGSCSTGTSSSYYYGGGAGSGGGYGGGYGAIGGEVETLRCEPPPCLDGGCDKDNTSAN
ncbi:fibronectin type III domain-containing protein [Microbulbifer agarilyticus]|uniref:fibronectin type III domain-containing protein n=1 Tax=Microbulbifer agarilyticus TaxID=260552 RepID=UPI001C939D7C|nr:fibronectin type III domain-containing protein [Microbulbifer agarilyticus]MBY6189644.1 fibronectin type III domain-containing protein [Microbulbifer agarilyticus]